MRNPRLLLFRVQPRTCRTQARVSNDQDKAGYSDLLSASCFFNDFQTGTWAILSGFSFQHLSTTFSGFPSAAPNIRIAKLPCPLMSKSVLVCSSHVEPSCFPHVSFGVCVPPLAMPPRRIPEDQHGSGKCRSSFVVPFRPFLLLSSSYGSVENDPYCKEVLIFVHCTMSYNRWVLWKKKNYFQLSTTYFVFHASSCF